MRHDNCRYKLYKGILRGFVMVRIKIYDFGDRIPADCVPYKTSRGVALVRNPKYANLTDKNLEQLAMHAPKMAVGFILGNSYEIPDVDTVLGFEKGYSLWPVLFARRKGK